MRHCRGVFVSGTDTGVGKTAVAAALAAWARAQGWDVGVMKPVATGGTRSGPRGPLFSDDARALARAARADDDPQLINPICLAEPLAPWTAARRAARAITWAPIRRAAEELRRRHQLLIVEGAGGLLVPLSRSFMVAHVAQQLSLPVLLVSRPGLGTLNHTLLSLACLRQLSIPCRGVLINYPVPPDRNPAARLAERTNPSLLRSWTRVLGVLPFRPLAERRRDPDGAAWIASRVNAADLRRVLGL